MFVVSCEFVVLGWVYLLLLLVVLYVCYCFWFSCLVLFAIGGCLLVCFDWLCFAFVLVWWLIGWCFLDLFCCGCVGLLGWVLVLIMLFGLYGLWFGRLSCVGV